MTASKRLCQLLSILLLMVFAACSSPDPVLYTIAPVPGSPAIGGPKVVLLQTVGLARYLDRPQIVHSSADDRLDVRTNDWWGEPLGPMLGRVLADELGNRLPQSIVISDGSVVSATPDATVELDIRQLNGDSTGSLILQAQASVTFKGKKPSVLRNIRIVVPAPDAGIPGQVKATSTAVGQLADRLASVLVTGR
jgi:uncharacterized lipoprotein YmbA